MQRASGAPPPSTGNAQRKLHPHFLTKVPFEKENDRLTDRGSIVNRNYADLYLFRGNSSENDWEISKSG